MISLKEHIEDVRAKLRTGSYTNEAAISHGVVIRLLQALGWPVYDTAMVWPEFTVEGGRVDWALCQNGRPVVFVEVKAVGRCVDADRQLFEYAFRRGVPLAILTDGREWHFYLPAAEGHFEDRKVYKLDFAEMEAVECEKRLSRYLSYQGVCSGDALKFAREDLGNASKDREIKRTIPRAWSKLIEEQDSILLELLADKVEDLCGYKPDIDRVADFLSTQISNNETITSQPGTRKSGGQDAVNPPAVAPGGYYYIFEGRRVSGHYARDILVKVIIPPEIQTEVFGV